MQFERKYTTQRRMAIYRAKTDLGLEYKEIMRRAKAGTLVPGDPFEVPYQQVGRIIRAESAARAGRYNSPLSGKPHRDAVEELRVAAIGVADYLLSDLMQRARKHPDKVDAKRLQDAIKAVTMAAAMPAKTEDRPVAPGESVGPGGRVKPSGSAPRGTLLEAMRAVGAIPGPEPEDPADD